MSLPTPPLTPRTFPFSTGNVRSTASPRWNRRHAHAHTPSVSSPLAGPVIDDDLELPPPLETVPELEMPEATLQSEPAADEEELEKYKWRPDMSQEERDARDVWIAGARGRKGLRIVIVTGESTCSLFAGAHPAIRPTAAVEHARPTLESSLTSSAENFLPKVDGVTRTLARLLEHLKSEGHQCMLLGPGSGMVSPYNFNHTYLSYNADVPTPVLPLTEQRR